MQSVGQAMHDLAKELWPIPRSVTGAGVRETLAILKREIPAMTLREVPTGTKCFDWTVPREWVIRDAYIVGPDGKKFAEFKKNNLHLVGYSVPMDEEMDLDSLQKNLHSLPAQPNAIPYVTSYYKEGWGFCLSDNERSSLKPGKY
ncbi:MAG: DUF2172 domain-containing protein, partial [Gemmatimonadota bacterium]|nr:DUF2172 domain-containing protein [Gemmatimonadota bacterium]